MNLIICFVGQMTSIAVVLLWALRYGIMTSKANAEREFSKSLPKIVEGNCCFHAKGYPIRV